jgi:hypothetical protein
MLGHQPAKVTVDTYADLFDTDVDAVAAALDLKRARTGAQRREPGIKTLSALRCRSKGAGGGGAIATPSWPERVGCRGGGSHLSG